MQVIDDFRDSLAETGPKLSRHVEAVTSQIESQLPKLISPIVPICSPSPIASLLRKIAPSDLADRVSRGSNRCCVAYSRANRRLDPHGPTRSMVLCGRTSHDSSNS